MRLLSSPKKLRWRGQRCHASHARLHRHCIGVCYGRAFVVHANTDDKIVFTQGEYSTDTVVVVTQSGASTIASFIQDGSLKGLVIQNNSGNMANISQGGMMDVSYVTQTGNGNMVTVTQNVIP